MDNNVVIIQDDDDNTVSIYEGVAPNAGGDHNHDERYYTESETTALLASKANTVHPHAIADVSDLQTQLDGKQVTLVSGTNIKTVNGSTLLGSGDIVISGGSSGGVTDHGALTGLADDDHTQYHNDTRGDARYYIKSEVTAYLAAKSDTGHNHTLTSLSEKSYNSLTDKPIIPTVANQVTVGPTGSGATYTTDGTDDHIEINNAINAVYALGGGTVSILAGTYTLANNIIVKKYVSLEGAGFNTRLKFGNGITLTEAGMIRVKDSTDRPTDVRISKLNLDGNKANNTTTGVKFYGVYTEADNVIVEDCWVHDFTGYGIDPHEAETTSTPGSRLIIRNNYVYNNGTIANQDYDGITLDMMYECVCTGNITFNNARHGINIVTGTEKTIIANNVSYGNGRNGIVLTDQSSYVNITGNYIHSNGREGILTATGSQHLNITGNYIYSNGYNGIHLYGSSYNNVVGNKLRNNGKATHNTYSDIYIDDDAVTFSTYNLIADNHISSNEANQPKYGIEERNVSNDFNRIGMNAISGVGTGETSIKGVNSITLVGNLNPTFNGMTIANGTNVTLATGTGTMFGTATSQKIAFLGSAPAIQQAATTDLGSVLSTFGLRAAGGAYPLATSGLVALTGPLRYSQTARTAGATLTAGTSSPNQLIDATTAAITITLAATATAGYVFFIKKVDSSANAVTIQSGTGNSIDGAQTYILSAQWQGVEIVSTTVSGAWRIIGKV